MLQEDPKNKHPLLVWNFTSSSGSSVMVSMSTGDSSFSEDGTGGHFHKKGVGREGPGWIKTSCIALMPAWDPNAREIIISPNKGGCWGSSSPFRLLRLISSSPDSSDSPFLSTENRAGGVIEKQHHLHLLIYGRSIQRLGKRFCIAFHSTAVLI